jgi:hypothetical protein
MALSLEGAHFVKRKAVLENRAPKIAMLFKALFSYLAQHKGNPDLQYVAFAALTTTATVIADAACRLYALYLKKPAASTTASWVHGTNHASTAASTAATFRAYLPTSNEELLIFPDGLALSAGLVLISVTAAGGATESAAADRATGFGIVGGA